MHLLRLLLLRIAGSILRRLLRPRPSGAPRRVLVIKPDNLGDVVLLTPALRLLRERLPHAEIVLLLGPWGRAAITHNPDLDGVLECRFPGFGRAARPSLLQPYMVLLKTALLLRAGNFDAAIIARDDHWWGALLAATAGIPRIAGYGVPEVAPFLTDTLPHSYADHAAAQAIRLVEALVGGQAARRPALRAPSGEADHAWAHDWIERHCRAGKTEGAWGGAGHPLFAIHPGTGGAAKLWLSSRWVAVADALHASGDIVLTAGPDERELVEAIARRMQRPPLVLAGEATLGQLAALYARCALVLGVDSGPLHLAAASGTPTIALFGPGDAGRFGPWGDPKHNRVVRSGLWCSPCGVIDACPRGTAPSECMAQLTVEDVLAAIGQVMSDE